METLQELYEEYEETSDVALLDLIAEEEYLQDLNMRVREYYEVILEYNEIPGCGDWRDA